MPSAAAASARVRASRGGCSRRVVLNGRPSADSPANCGAASSVPLWRRDQHDSQVDLTSRALGIQPLLRRLSVRPSRSHACRCRAGGAADVAYCAELVASPAQHGYVARALVAEPGVSEVIDGELLAPAALPTATGGAQEPNLPPCSPQQRPEVHVEAEAVRSTPCSASANDG